MCSLSQNACRFTACQIFDRNNKENLTTCSADVNQPKNKSKRRYEETLALGFTVNAVGDETRIGCNFSLKALAADYDMQLKRHII